MGAKFTMMAKIENDENLTQFSRRNLKKLGQSFQDEKTLMSMRESRDTPPLNAVVSKQEVSSLKSSRYGYMSRKTAPVRSFSNHFLQWLHLLISELNFFFLRLLFYILLEKPRIWHLKVAARGKRKNWVCVCIAFWNFVSAYTILNTLNLTGELLVS